MKKLGIILALVLVLSGCSAAQTFETVGDGWDNIQTMSPAVLQFALPGDAAAQVMRGENGALYFCEGYEIMVQTLQGGDLNATLKALTGYDAKNLTVMETAMDGTARYECIWLSAGETGDQIGRTMILDDGDYHYCLSVTAAAEDAGSLQDSWQELYASVSLQG